MTPRLKTPLALALTAVMLFPVYWMLNVSFTRRESIRSADLLPFDPTLAHYKAALTDQLPYLGTSVLVGLGTVALTVAVAAPAGFGLAKLRVPGKQFLSFVLIAAQMVPAVVMALGFYSLFNTLGIFKIMPVLIISYSTIALP